MNSLRQTSPHLYLIRTGCKHSDIKTIISCHLRLKSSSAASSIDNIFSAENKARCQANAISVKPVREVPWTMKGQNLRQASVLVPLCIIDGQPAFLFTLRTRHLGSHSGQVSFPGGKQDSGETLVETALREAREEIGLDTSSTQVWGHMQPVPAKNFEMAVTPVMAFIGEIGLGDLTANHREVAEIFGCSVSSLISPANTHFTHFVGAHRYTLPVYTGNRHRIWGLTAIILHQALSLLLPQAYTFKVPKLHLVR